MRPAGLFLVVPFFLTVVYLWWSGRTLGETLAFAVPFPALLLALCVYNWNVAGMFTVTGWGEANIAAATFIYWEPDPAYPDDVNQRITKIREVVALTDEQRQLLQTSWTPSVVAPIYARSFDLTALGIAMETGGDYVAARQWMRRISADAIRKHRDLYVKFVGVMASLFLVDNIVWQSDYVNELNGRSLMLLTADGRAELARDRLNGDMVARYFQPPASLQIAPVDACAHGGAPAIEPTTARRIYRVTQRVRDLIFGRLIFAATAAVAFGLALWRLWQSRGRHDMAFIALMLGLSVIGSGMVVCLVEYAGHRYSYPTEFAIFVTTALLPWLGRARG